MPAPYKYHVVDHVVSVCAAPLRCSLGGPDAHYRTEHDAIAADTRAHMVLHGPQLVSLDAEVLPPHLVQSVLEHQSAKLPPGSYFIGDAYTLIASVDQHGWNAYCDAVEASFGWHNDVDAAQDPAPIVAARYAGLPLTSVKAQHGAGLYWSVSPPRRVPADAGLVCIMPLAILDAMNVTVEALTSMELGFVHDFTESFSVKRYDNGTIAMGEGVLIVADATLPAEAQATLEAGAAAGTTYPIDQERDKLRRDTYHRVVNEFLAREV